MLAINLKEVPGFQYFMRPFLEVLSDGKEKHMLTIIDEIVKREALTEEQLAQKIPSGRATLVGNRIAWVRTYLYKAGLIHRVARGIYSITESAKVLLSTHSGPIDVKVLRQLQPFQNWLASFDGSGAGNESEEVVTESTLTPLETLDASYESIMQTVGADLLERLKNCKPVFFESLVVKVLMAMGYGGFNEDRGEVTQYSGDGGIDGIIKEDKLGLDTIYIQAKRWDNTVPVSAVRDFAGSLLSKKARKGVFITTSNFPQSAYQFVGSIDPKIVLIDGQQLTKMMLEYNVGVVPDKVYELKKVHNDFFDEEE